MEHDIPGGAEMSGPKIGDLVLHVHHDTLLEPLTEPMEARARYIRTNKPPHEIETRLRLMKPLIGRLPELDKACAVWNKARAERDKACVEWTKARVEWTKACAQPSVLALHAKECPNCPWDGRTIFPEVRPS